MIDNILRPPTSRQRHRDAPTRSSLLHTWWDCNIWSFRIYHRPYHRRTIPIYNVYIQSLLQDRIKQELNKLKTKKQLNQAVFLYREWDSNPQALAGKRF